MFGKFFIGRSGDNLDDSPRFLPYTKVVCTVDENTEYTAGDDSGRTMTVDLPWATQEITEKILASLSGYSYQPYDMRGANIDPAAELGDAVITSGIYGGIYDIDVDFSQLYKADISAPEDEEIEHEYPFVPQKDRKVTRRLNNMQSDLIIQAGKIEATVSDTGGDESFGWSLKSDKWEIKANGMDVLTASRTGLAIEGEIRAKRGTIGGWNIDSTSIYSNNNSIVMSSVNGLYGGTEGKKWSIDLAGNAHFQSGTFDGTVRAGHIEYGGKKGYLNGKGITVGTITGGSSGQLAKATISTHNTAGGINTSLGYADYANGFFSGFNEPTNVLIDQAQIKRIIFAYKTLYIATSTVMGTDGKPKEIKYVGWRDK